MKPLDSGEFVRLREEIEAHPRLCGYYIIKLIDITDLRNAGKSQEEVAEEVFQYFDDKEWPPLERRPSDQTWADYRAEAQIAREHAIEALVGGPPVGHSRETISQVKADGYFDRFDALFDAPKNHYVGMVFGDRKYVFMRGVAIISRFRAGVLWVVEDD